MTKTISQATLDFAERQWAPGRRNGPFVDKLITDIKAGRVTNRQLLRMKDTAEEFARQLGFHDARVAKPWERLAKFIEDGIKSESIDVLPEA